MYAKGGSVMGCIPGPFHNPARIVSSASMGSSPRTCKMASRLVGMGPSARNMVLPSMMKALSALFQNGPSPRKTLLPSMSSTQEPLEQKVPWQRKSLFPSAMKAPMPRLPKASELWKTSWRSNT